jgi:hypothetical protein
MDQRMGKQKYAFKKQVGGFSGGGAQTFLDSGGYGPLGHGAQSGADGQVRTPRERARQEALYQASVGR